MVKSDELDKSNIKKYNLFYGRLANINGISALLATSATSFLYPFEVMKFRMQCKIFIFLVNNIRNVSLVTVFTETYNKEGVRGLFRGFVFTSFVNSFATYLYFFQ